jgi:methylmalonyl-CoA mutase
VFGGGGGVIVPAEIRELHAYGVTRIYSPEDGQRMGLQGMIGEMVMRCDQDLSAARAHATLDARSRVTAKWPGARWPRLITALENGKADAPLKAAGKRLAARKVPVLGITGTGGAGKSSLTDELIRRLRLDQDDTLRVAVISIDPSRAQERRRAAGRPHPHERHRAVAGARVFMRSAGHARLRQRDQPGAARRDRRLQGGRLRPGHRRDLRHRPGRRRHRAAVDVPLYVMTPEFGAASQLEKIDMLDFAEFVAINKFDRKGAEDALRDVAKQVQRNKEAFGHAPGADAGVRHHGRALQRRRRDRAVPGAEGAPGRSLGLPLAEGRLPLVNVRHSTNQTPVVPAARTRYLAEISRHRARLQAARPRAGAPGSRDAAAARNAAPCSKLETRQGRRTRPKPPC